MLSTHIMQEVEAICSRVIIIDHGRIVADGPIDEISSLAGARLEETFRQLTGNSRQSSFVLSINGQWAIGNRKYSFRQSSNSAESQILQTF